MSEPASAEIHPIGKPAIPIFEGAAPKTIAVKISGLSAVTAADLPVFTIDDRVRLVGEFKCIAVRHTVDPKTGEVIREQILSPIEMDTAPWNPNDPRDDGVIRAR